MTINWNKPLEWSTGETTAVAYNSFGGPVEVESCREWVDQVGDNRVSVDKDTGKIVGCEDEDYPHVRNVAEAERPAVWLHLFHGRSSPDEELDDWGCDGPCIGPLNYVHITYACDVKLACSYDVARKFFPDVVAAEEQRDAEYAEKYGRETSRGELFEHRICFHEDLLPHDGKFYGDISIAAFEEGAVDFNA